MVDVAAGEATLRPPARRSSALRRFFRHRLATIGMFVIAVLTIGAAGAPWLAPHDPDEIDISQRYAPPLTQGHILGSDDLGRDVLTRLLYAGQVSLSVGTAAMLVTVIVGFAVGAFAAYHGGWVNVVLMRFADVMLCFPTVFLLLFVAAFVTPSLLSIALMIGLTCWMEIARIVYAQILVLKSADFIAAAQNGRGAVLAHHRASDPPQHARADLRRRDAKHGERHPARKLY